VVSSPSRRLHFCSWLSGRRARWRSRQRCRRPSLAALWCHQGHAPPEAGQARRLCAGQRKELRPRRLAQGASFCCTGQGRRWPLGEEGFDCGQGPCRPGWQRPPAASFPALFLGLRAAPCGLGHHQGRRNSGATAALCQRSAAVNITQFPFAGFCRK
jgi:hypothetical protein